MSPGSSPALLIRFPPDTSPAQRDRLVALLSDFDLVAIQEDDLTAPRVWTAHFGSVDSRAAALEALDAAGITPARIDRVEIEDDDWARRTQADLPAIRVGRIVVAPPWDLPVAAAAGGEIVIEIEPSRGFGTGHHQSTRLCLVLLQSRDLTRQTVIDVGTGSGVLAIAAARLGAAFVSAFDNDPDAVENARENVERNQLHSIVEVHRRDLSEPDLPPAADVVTANLTGTLLARHAEVIGRLVRPYGSLIAAGFTIDEKPLVVEAFANAFELTESAEEDDWWGVGMRRIT